jgi:hypothetical protein
MGRVLETPVDRWRNRRKMAWLSMFAGLLFPLLILGTDDPNLGAIAVPFYMFVSAVVGAYIGFATWDDKNVKFKNDIDSSSECFNYRGEHRMGSKRMAAQRSDRPPESRP